MLTILVLGFISAAAADPLFNYYYGSYSPGYSSGVYYEPYNNYNTRDSWTSYGSNKGSSSSQTGIVDNKYQLSIPLDGFEEKDIVIKSQRGMLIVDACRRVGGGCGNTYFSSNAIPNYVDAGTGVWTYKQGILKVVFSLKTDSKASTGQHQTTYRYEAPVTATPTPQRPDDNQVHQIVTPVPQQADNRNNGAGQRNYRDNSNAPSTRNVKNVGGYSRT